MKNLVCNFVPVRLMPYRDVGEFVVVGVVAHCPQTGFFDYRLTKRRTKVSKFFPELETDVFVESLSALREHLHRFKNVAPLFLDSTGNGWRCDDQMNAFTMLIRQREGLLNFGDPSTRIVDDPTAAINEVFSRLVERRFASGAQYQEKMMKDQVRKLLGDWGLLPGYKRDAKVGDHSYSVTFAFVTRKNDGSTTVIHPLDLDKDTSTELINHGDRWISKLKRLKERSKAPERLIIPINRPSGRPGREPLTAEAHAIEAELTGQGATIIEQSNESKLRDLASIV